MATQESAHVLPTTLPQYPELIISAIEAVDDKNGANKTTISKPIESIYGLKPDPNAPPRRGRGRPPKAKTSPPPDAVVSPPRPRGRPPKTLNPDAQAAAEKTKSPTVSGRKRGRPKKSESGAKGRGSVFTRSSCGGDSREYSGVAATTGGGAETGGFTGV